MLIVTILINFLGGVKMFKEKVEFALIRAGMSKKDLADKLEITSQNLYDRMKRDNMTETQMKEMAEALGGELVLKIRIGDVEF